MDTISEREEQPGVCVHGCWLVFRFRVVFIRDKKAACTFTSQRDKQSLFITRIKLMIVVAVGIEAFDIMQG